MRSGEPEPMLVQFYQSLSKICIRELPSSCRARPMKLRWNLPALRQGVFSHFLIRGLKGEADTNSDKVVTVEELYDFVNKKCANTRQIVRVRY
jgi:hypothetical protein